MPEETAAELLQRVGTDGAAWAAEFRTIAIGLGYSDMDEGWLIGWFANAIEAGRGPDRDLDVRCEKRCVLKTINSNLQQG